MVQFTGLAGEITKAHMSLQRAGAVGCKIPLVALCRVVWCRAHMVFSLVSALTESALQIGTDWLRLCSAGLFLVQCAVHGSAVCTCR